MKFCVLLAFFFKGNQYEFLTHPKIKGLDGGLLGLEVNNIIIEFITSQNDIATFIYAINSIRKSVRLAQVVEQWTGNPEVGGSSPPSNPLIFGCVRNSY